MPKKNNPFAKLHIVNLKCVPCGNRKTDFEGKASGLKLAGSVPVNYTLWLLVLQLKLEIFISPFKTSSFPLTSKPMHLPVNMHTEKETSRQYTGGG